jgi:hypothetical protein
VAPTFRGIYRSSWLAKRSRTARHLADITTKSRQRMYAASIRASAQRAKEALKEANRLACEAWNMRILGYKADTAIYDRPACATGSTDSH